MCLARFPFLHTLTSSRFQFWYAGRGLSYLNAAGVGKVVEKALEESPINITNTGAIEQLVLMTYKKDGLI